MLSERMMMAAAGGVAPPSQDGLWMWGYNSDGQLGLDDTADRSSPVQVGSLTTWDKIACGSGHTLVVKTDDGTLWAWGNNYHGQLGTGNRTYRSSPVQVGGLTNWETIDAAENYSIAIKTDGTIWAWGRNNNGQLGTGNTWSRSAPTQIGSLTNWESVACGYTQAAAIKTDGTLWTWGNNYYGQLGLGYIYTPKSSPVQVGSLTDWTKVSSGANYMVALKTNGTLWAWGSNTHGQLGLGNITNRSSPVQIGSLTNWSDIDCGQLYVMVTKTDGTLWTWGYNNYGQLGLGDRTSRSSPVQVGSLTTWDKIACGSGSTSKNPSHTSTIKTDGTLWAWGENDSGELGLGDKVHRSSPVQVGSLTIWKSIVCGNYHTGGIIAE